jgi:hypothetical protein
MGGDGFNKVLQARQWDNISIANRITGSPISCVYFLLLLVKPVGYRIDP